MTERDARDALLQHLRRCGLEPADGVLLHLLRALEALDPWGDAADLELADAVVAARVREQARLGQ